MRSVTSDFAAPTRKWASSDTTAAAMIATVPVVNMNGITGMIPPIPVEIPAATDACTGSPPPPTVAPNSSAASVCNIASGLRLSCSASCEAVAGSIPFS